MLSKCFILRGLFIIINYLDMKKQKLSLKKLNITSFKTEDLTAKKGGTGSGDPICSDAICKTRDYTACYGEWYCQIYDTNPCGGF